MTSESIDTTQSRSAIRSISPSRPTLPNNAVLIANDGGRFVWKIVDGEAKATPVRTGDLTEQGLFILEGLNEGDIVVIGGYQKISEGMRVRAL